MKKDKIVLTCEHPTPDGHFTKVFCLEVDNIETFRQLFTKMVNDYKKKSLKCDKKHEEFFLWTHNPSRTRKEQEEFETENENEMELRFQKLPLYPPYILDLNDISPNDQMFAQKKSWVDLREVTKFSVQLLEDWFVQNCIEVKEKINEIC